MPEPPPPRPACTAGCGPLDLIVTVESSGTDHDHHPQQGTTQVIARVESCPVCRTGLYRRHEHDCTGWPTSASFPIEGEWTKPIAADDLDRLRESLSACPDPADGACRCPAHQSLLATQDCLRHRLPDPPSIAAAVTLADGLPQLRPVEGR
jgi:hypothetical protein